MQEEVDNKTIALCVRTSKITADLLRAAMREYLADAQRRKQTKQVSKEQENNVNSRGKQNLKKLMNQGYELKNIEITDNNIKSFDRVARKYGIDYSLKKDVSRDPPRYLVFFKARDVDVMTAAFKEYAGVGLQKSKKVSIRKKLLLAKERVAHQREREKTKQKDRGQSR